MSSKNPCIIPSDKSTFIFNIGVHVTILFTLLGLVFIFIFSKIISNSINNIFINKANANFSPIIKKFINKYPEAIPLINNINPNKFNDNDKIADVNNDWLFKIIYFTIGVCIAIVIIYYLLLRYNCNLCIPIKEILIINIIIFIFIGVIEYLFFTNIVTKYVPIKPSQLNKTFINDMITKL
jgi:hypothetical protein